MRPVLVLLGATGTGKTKLSLDIAKHFPAEVINADSMQVYKELDIVTAKATAEERASVPHHLIDFLQPHQMFNVIDYRNMAVKIIDDLLHKDKMPMIVGGTNYYVESVLWKILVSEIQEDTSALVSEREDGLLYKKFKSEDGEPPTNEYLHQKLKEVDPEMAEQLHPNNRRKILRSLQVWADTGKKHSQILREQREQGGGSLLGGPLRYQNALILWLSCQQNIHEKRLDDRVDSMIKDGLMDELANFHDKYNKARLSEGKVADYTTGIFQSIGFKEFHEYLMLSEEEKKSPESEKLLTTGIENMKIATKQYAKKQYKMTRNRLLGHPNRQMVPVYKLDTSDLQKWNENVRDLAIQIIENHMENKPAPIKPEELCVDVNNLDRLKPPVSHFCEICKRTFVGDFQFKIHMDSRRHKRTLSKHIKSQANEKPKDEIVTNEEDIVVKSNSSSL